MININLIIIGVYTLIYLIVFIIQLTQIRKQKNIIDSMEKFMNIFKVDEVKKYTDLVLESRNLELKELNVKLKNTTNNNERVIVLEQIINNKENIINEYEKLHQESKRMIYSLSNQLNLLNENHPKYVQPVSPKL